jgi:hypothetical protein
MALKPLDGFATVLDDLVNFSSIGWQTEADWDNATSESKVSHTDDNLSLGSVFRNGWESYSVGDNIAPNTPNLTTPESTWKVTDSFTNTGTRDFAYEGNLGTYMSFKVSGENPKLVYHLDSDTNIFKVAMRESKENVGFECSIKDPNGNTIIYWGSTNPNLFSSIGDPGDAISDQNNYEVWGLFTVELDYANNEAALTVEANDGSYTNTISGAFQNNADSFGTFEITAGFYNNDAGILEDELWMDLVSAQAVGSIQTAEKRHTEYITPNFENLDYSLNGGSITATAIGSPNSSFEERQTVSLDGSSDISISWDEEHSRYALELESSGAPTSPSVVDAIGFDANNPSNVFPKLFYDWDNQPVSESNVEHPNDMVKPASDTNTGTVTLPTQTVSSAKNFGLRDVDYSLNGGSIDVELTGSPSGTSETVTISLDGSSTSYMPAWGNKHTEVSTKVLMNRPDSTSVPSLARLGLMARSGVIVTSTLNADTAELTTYQDTNNTGTVDATDTHTVTGGTENFAHANLSPSAGDAVWWSVDVTDDGDVTTAVENIDVEINQ